MKKTPHSRTKRAGGRPYKFGEPSRPVTITLPERVLNLLAKVGEDRARALTKIVDAFSVKHNGAQSLVEVVPIAPGRAVIFVPNSRYLRSIPWLQLVEVAPARHLLALAEKTSIEKFEVTLVDLLEEVPDDEASEREILKELLACLRVPRRRQSVTKEEIIVLDVT